MAYADQSASNRRVISIVIVALLHALLGYAFITGLGANFIKKAVADLKTFDVEDEPPPPPDEPPPPPPDQPVEPPPMVAPPAIVQAPIIQAPIIQTVPVAPPPVITPTAPPAPPPPPAPRISQAAGAKGDPSKWIMQEDYPSGALRDEKEGVVRIAWDINEQGRAENCRVVSSSGTPELDDVSCRLIIRRGRYTPAKDTNGNPIRSSSGRSVRWQLEK